MKANETHITNLADSTAVATLPVIAFRPFYAARPRALGAQQ